MTTCSDKIELLTSKISMSLCDIVKGSRGLFHPNDFSALVTCKSQMSIFTNCYKMWVLQDSSKWLHVWRNLKHCKMKFSSLGIWTRCSVKASVSLLKPSEWQGVCQYVMGVGRPLLHRVSLGSDYPATINGPTACVKIHCRTDPPFAQHGRSLTRLSWLSKNLLITIAVIPAGD